MATPTRVGLEDGRGGARSSTGRARLAILALCAAGFVALVVTGLNPHVDVDVARASLAAPDALVRRMYPWVRPMARVFPVILCIGVVAAILTRAQPGERGRARRLALYLVLTLTLGPGLLVNAGLKAHSHRPRPLETSEVVGAGAPFQPYWSFSGTCARNCSFSSGEAAGAFWTTAPALLAPPGVVGLAVGSALCFGALVSVLRMTVGAHYLSDVAFSAVLASLISLGGLWLLGIGAPRVRPDRM